MPSATPKAPPHRIVLGVTGGIAAYKAVSLLRMLRDAGHHVAPVLTPDATRFVGTVTFSALASEPARTSLYGDPTTPIPHTYLGQGADLIVVAPATAHFLARYATGLADDLLTATLLASRAPVLLCPAMHTEMWEQPSVQENLATLRRRGVMILPPDAGHLAGGDEGFGRLPEPEHIAALIEQILTGYRGPLSGRRLVISAGGTSEALDPVRMLTNRSSGHQGYALAEVATRLGAQVTLVSAAHRSLAIDVARHIDVVQVESAAQMAEAVLTLAPVADAVIMAAAVSDFTVERSPQKIKRSQGVPRIDLEPTVDIVRALVAQRTARQLVVAFAAETHDVLSNATAKLHDKDVDLLVVNDVSQSGVGFGHDTNEVTLLQRDAPPITIGLRSKEGISEAILARVTAMFSQGVS